MIMKGLVADKSIISMKKSQKQINFKNKVYKLFLHIQTFAKLWIV